ncbi:MAG: PD-(D/E)XK nuclease family protein, partial [Ruminococcus sp.]|nr:PD-(D/E)XK nuclease family protein [Candidatus Copronaster equi]
EQADDTYITLCISDEKEIDDFNAFAHTKRTQRKIIKTAQKRSVNIAKPTYINLPDNRYSNSELAFLEKGIYHSKFEQYNKKTENIILCSAKDIESECEFVAHTVKKIIRTENLRCRDIAIISRSEDNYSRSIRHALKKNGVPVFEDKRQGIDSQPLIEYVCSAIDIALNGFSVDSVMRLLKTGLTNLTFQEISELENYALTWHYNGSKWLDEWTAHPDGLGEKMHESDLERLSSINKSRQEITKHLQPFRIKFKDFTGLDAAKAIYDLLIQMNVNDNLKNLAIKLNNRGENELAVEQNRVWDLLMEILDRIAQALENTHLTVSRFADLFNLIISTYTIGNIPQGIDEIVIGSAERVKTSSPKIIFALGMNDGVFPMIPVSGGILSENERRILKEMNLETDDSFEEKMMEEYFIAYNTLCSACDRLFVSYVRKNPDGSNSVPSEIVNQLCNIFPNITTIDTENTDEIDFVEGADSAFELLAKKTFDSDVLHATLEKYFRQREDFKGRLQAIKRSSDKEEFKITDSETAKKLFGLNMYMSASRTEVYHKCPFEYFCKYGLNAQPRKTAELDPMKKGTAIHYILEHLISAYGSDGLCSMPKNQRDDCINDLLEKYFAEILVSGEDLGERFEYLFNQLGLVISEVVDRLVAEFSVSLFEPVAFELKIDDDGEVKTYDIPLPDGGMLRLKGSVDRVDAAKLEKETLIRVVDYKSGGKKFSLNEVYYGLNMQMLIYLFAIWKNGFGDYQNIKPAGILYMPVNAPFANVERDEAQETIESEKQKKSKMNGLILDDSRIVYAMDGGDGKFIPAKIKKDGVCSGTLISFKQMGLLVKKVEKILTEMAMNLHNGVIRVKPAVAQSTSSPYHDVCKYCDYKEVCGFDEDTPTNEIENISHEDSLKALGGEEDA